MDAIVLAFERTAGEAHVAIIELLERLRARGRGRAGKRRAPAAERDGYHALEKLPARDSILHTT